MTKKKTKGSEGGGNNNSNNNIADASDRKRHEQPLQAVVLAADWYATTTTTSRQSSAAFQPMDRPKVLCPIVNQTMIDYTINYLCSQGVQELYIVCASYEVEVHVNGILSPPDPSPLDTNDITMKIVVIRDSTITNDGDALREMEKRNVIQSDPFILMYGDTITNVSLPEKIKLYQQYRTTIDTSTISMMLFKSIGTSSPLHSTMANNVIVGFNNNNNNNHRGNEATAASSSSSSILGPDHDTTSGQRILLYDNHTCSSNPSSKKYMQFPCSFMNQICNDIMIRTDLYDTGIDICSPELLVRFSDEFDYQNIRNEFVTNTVAEEEIGLQQSIYGCIVANTEYAARVHDFRIYHHISHDILRRYVYPTVPDNVAMTSFRPRQLVSPSSSSSSSSSELLRYAVQHHFMYHQYEGGSSPMLNDTKMTTTRIGRTSIITGPGLIGHNCRLEEHCSIRSSVIGNSCSISNHCTITNSHIWDNTIIESNVTIHHSIIASHVVIKSGVTIPRGCIIGTGCIIGRNMKLAEYTRLTCTKPNDDDDFNMDGDHDDWDDEDKAGDNKTENSGILQIPRSADDDDDNFVSDVDVVGTDGKGRVWQPPSTDNDDDDDDDDDEAMKGDNEQRITTNDDAIKSQCIGYNVAHFYLDRVPYQDYKDDDDSFSDEDEYDDHEMGHRQYNSDYGDDDDEEDQDNAVQLTFGETAPASMTIIGRQDGVDVVKELKLICLEYEGGSIDNLGIELNSYKFSQNATYADCTMAAIMAVMEKIPVTTKMSDGKLISEFKSSLEQWSSLLTKMCIGVDEEKAIVLGLERCAIGDTTNNNNNNEDVEKSNQEQIVTKLSSGMSFRLLLQTLHNEEIVSEEAILLWAHERRTEILVANTSGGGGGGTKHVANEMTLLQERRMQLFQLPPVQEFLEWLEDGDDDDDDDEEDDEDEDDE